MGERIVTKWNLEIDNAVKTSKAIETKIKEIEEFISSIKSGVITKKKMNIEYEEAYEEKKFKKAVSIKEDKKLMIHNIDEKLEKFSRNDLNALKSIISKCIHLVISETKLFEDMQWLDRQIRKQIPNLLDDQNELVNKSLQRDSEMKKLIGYLNFTNTGGERDDAIIKIRSGTLREKVEKINDIYKEMKAEVFVAKRKKIELTVIKEIIDNLKKEESCLLLINEYINNYSKKSEEERDKVVNRNSGAIAKLNAAFKEEKGKIEALQKALGFDASAVKYFNRTYEEQLEEIFKSELEDTKVSQKKVYTYLKNKIKERDLVKV